MKLPRIRRVWIVAATFVIATFAAAMVAATTAAGEHNSYVVHNLVSDVAGRADKVDTKLVNGWGLDARPTSPWWVADNETDLSTLYLANGDKLGLEVQVPHAPTGLVANPGTGADFVVSNGVTSGPALFIFATEEGKILGWSPAVAPTQALVAADKSGAGAIFKGLAVASTPAGDFLYATDFHNGQVDVFDDSFGDVNMPGAFVDPTLPAGFAPFGIQSIGDHIFVTYAKQDAAMEDEVAGQGLGFVDEFDTDGNFLGRVAGHGQLNAPWGLAAAPSNFGRFGGDLLIGNFGDGQINAFAQQPRGNYEHRGELKGADGRSIAIDGLWALQFGKGATNNGPIDTLFFTAGPDEESHGLFGTIRSE